MTHETHCNLLHPLAASICDCSPHEDCDYADVTLREWAEYEFATIEYDYLIHPQAAEMIRGLFDRFIK